MKNKVEKILSYFAVFDPAEEGGYNVAFPDFPGCVTFGKTFEESKEKAQEVLELWLEELASQRKVIPMRSSRPIIDEVKVASPRKSPIPA
ncbi:MAG: type II toxin-antitoxin system HicB family antitoxin [Candidatus Sungbacteria bacterium]|nr:type II toxin-antitoxin system HicB family antitoxin [Candidatus Sungbacteria bacterium]